MITVEPSTRTVALPALLFIGCGPERDTDVRADVVRDSVAQYLPYSDVAASVHKLSHEVTGGGP